MTNANTLRTAVSGDAGDVRRLRLTGVADLTQANTLAGWVWRASVPRASVPITVVDEQHVDADFGTWLDTNPAAADWWFEIDVDDVTWPGARQPAILPVRARSA